MNRRLLLLLVASALGGLMLFPAIASAEDGVYYSDQNITITQSGLGGRADDCTACVVWIGDYEGPYTTRRQVPSGVSCGDHTP